ncbi:MAG TPA: N-6 DNA methylase [Puia sp.]|nr:N-6 DNA methylase [Puia sp.]
MDKKQLQTSILEKTYQPEKWLEVMKEYFGAKKFHIKPLPVSLAAKDIAESAVELGSFYTADERLVGIYEVRLNPKAWIERNRVGLRSLLRQVYKYDVDAALIVFVQADKWRFSYVSEIRTEEGKKETEPKRYTYLFGKGESCRTAAERFDKLKGKPIYLDDLFDAFNVEKLNKEFFKTYKDFYLKGVAEIIERKPYYKLLIDKTQEDEEKKEKPIRDFVKKMLGRIVFLHFLQKKGWMGVPAKIKNEKLIINNWIDGDIKFLQNLFLHCPDQAHFLSKYLRILFFETLNTKRKNDLAPKQLSYKSSNPANPDSDSFRIPYLNGGLFDKDNSFYNDIDFTADYFKNLLEFFEQYNFTIDENDPYDNEVGIDPEMLGHIFENLLEENKDKGAFYTPKEVVHYMCQESLIQYLRTHLPECTEDDSPATIALQNFIRNGVIGERTDKKNFVVQQAKRIEKFLDNVKICDPAIGSGAFPMGMLQEIYKAKTNLDLTLDHTEVKKQIIQNCIYGVDIENGAVEIARLRFWLALVVDETEPHPLPNLDYKIMQGNSLLESFEGVDLSNLADMDKDETFLSADKHQLELGADFSLKKQSMLVFDQKSKTQLYELISDYYSYDETANTKYKSKQFIKDEINKIVEGKLIAKFYLQKPKLEQKIKDIHIAIKANRLMTADAPGVRLRKEKNLEKLSKELADKENEFEKLNSIIEHLHELQTRTDKPYFLWHLWFKDVFDKGGFDIVIGNPPYIQLQKMVKEADVLKHANFKTFERTGDIYTLFFEQGFKHLKPKGNLVFITGSAWLRSNYGKAMRKFFVENTNGKILIDLSDAEVFESATVLTTIHLFTKEKNEKQLKALRLTKKNQDIIKSLPSNFDKLHTLIKNLDENAWVIADTNKQMIKSKIVEQGKKLKEWDIEINRGIVTGLNEAFIIDEVERNELIKEDSRNKEIIKPLLRGKDLTKYKFDFKSLWLLYIPWHFPLTDDDSIMGASKKAEDAFKEKYPSIYNHLLKFKKDLVERNKDETGIRYEWYALQRYGSKFWKDFEKPKILYPNMVKDISFTYDDKGYYVNDKCFILTGEKIKYLLAVFNSKLFRYCFEDDFPELQGNSREIKAFVMRELFVKYPNDKEQKPFESLANKILHLKKDNLPTAIYENKIDALVFHLYNLTESEMLQVLDTFKDLDSVHRTQIQNEYRNIANGKFSTEV